MHEHRVRKDDSRPQRFSTRGFVMLLVLFAITGLLAVASTADSAAAVTQRADHERSDHELYGWNTNRGREKRQIDEGDYSSVIIPPGFLPFGPAYGDSRVPTRDDDSTEEIQLGTDIIILGSHQNKLYVSTNGLLSFGQPFFDYPSSGANFNSVSSPPLIAPFWDDVDVTKGGTIYYRQDNTSSIAEHIQQDISLQFHNISLFYPSLVFVATWDRVAPFGNSGVVNTFQVIVASDGTRTFVRFNYGDIQWGGFSTLIGVSIGDRANFISHPDSLSPSVLSLDNSTTTYFISSNATTNLVPCPCNSSENCFSFEDDSGTEICSCIPGYELQMTNQSGQVCTDVNECISSSHNCGTGICFNTPGSYTCDDICPPGYFFNTDIQQCDTVVTAIDYSNVIIPPGFLPFGPDYGDSCVPTALDGSTDEIRLETDIIIFRSHQNELYVSTNGLLSFGEPFFDYSSFGANFDSVRIPSPPLIAPFWDDVDVRKGGTVYYRQDNTSSIAEQIQQNISSQFHNIGLFYPSLVFIATWDRVASYNNYRGVVNTFQVVVASDGTRTFVRFNYEDIQWGGPWTLIGVSIGDRANFITHPASLSPSVLSLDNYTTKYFEVGFLESAAIRFNSSIYTVSEDDSFINLTIVKNISDAESTTDNITVHFITSDQTAKASEDYDSTNLTVTFGPDESETTVQVPIINDLSREKSETFYGNLMFNYQSELLLQVHLTGVTGIKILYNDCNCDCTNSSCSCHNGYFGNGFFCLDIDECENELHDCDMNATCTNTIGNFECTCNDGFLGDGKICISNATINLVPCPCNSSENCFTFEDDNSTEMCSCKPGYEQQMTNQNGQVCTDVDECISRSYDCGNGTCANIPGSYTCVCPSGYVFNIDSQQCVDLDECETDLYSNCDENANCFNTEGSYNCTCRDGFIGNGLICLNNSDCKTLNCSQECANITGSLTCACHPGYFLNTFNLRECEDLNECDLRLDICDINAECKNTIGSYECQCNSGYLGNGWICNDIDECDIGLDDCASSICYNSNGSYDCGSRSEPNINLIQPERPNHDFYYAVGNDFCLEGMDSLFPSVTLECSLVEQDPLVRFTFILNIYLVTQNISIPLNVSVVNGTLSVFQVSSLLSISPFFLEYLYNIDNITSMSVTCFAANAIGEDNATTHITFCGPTECQDGVTNNCTQTCTRAISNGTSSYECGCYEGYELDSDNTTCVDLDECDLHLDSCDNNADCNNIPGSYECKCRRGYHGNGFTCNEIDHCASKPCHPNATCTNTRTSYHCRCDTGYEGNGMDCKAETSSRPPNDNLSTALPIATINSSTTPPITTIPTINSSTFPPLTANANSERDTTVIISSTIGAVAFLLLIAVLVLIICFFRNFLTISKNKNDLLFRNTTFDQYDGSPRELNRDFFPRTISVQSSYKLNLPQHLLIPASDIKLVEPIGQGEFGIVYKGYIIKKQGNIVTDTVAVKTLKGMYNRTMVREMLKECSKMYNFNHPNVLTLRGVCLDGGTAPYIIMPFMANGSLLAYLKKNRETLIVSLSDKDEDDVTPIRKRLMDMCIQVAKGMEYLTSKKVVHRDLAARNCMIDMNFVIKVADFGLAESVETEYFRQDKSSHIKLPLRWLAPESMEDYVFSEKSDIWAYGVTCWEIFSGGKVPYGGVTITDLSRLLADGHRLEKPNNDACSDQLYQLLLQCWKFERVDRPRFADIVSTLSESLGAMAGYLDIGAFSGESTAAEINECRDLVEEQSLNQASKRNEADESTV